MWLSRKRRGDVARTLAVVVRVVDDEVDVEGHLPLGSRRFALDAKKIS